MLTKLPTALFFVYLMPRPFILIGISNYECKVCMSIMLAIRLTVDFNFLVMTSNDRVEPIPGLFLLGFC